MLGLSTMSDLEAVQRSVQSSQPNGTIEVTVRHNGAETKVIGNPENVVRELVIFFSKAYPSLEPRHQGSYSQSTPRNSSKAALESSPILPKGL